MWAILDNPLRDSGLRNIGLMLSVWGFDAFLRVLSYPSLVLSIFLLSQAAWMPPPPMG